MEMRGRGGAFRRCTKTEGFRGSVGYETRDWTGGVLREIRGEAIVSAFADAAHRRRQDEPQKRVPSHSSARSHYRHFTKLFTTSAATKLREGPARREWGGKNSRSAGLVDRVVPLSLGLIPYVSTAPSWRKEIRRKPVSLDAHSKSEEELSIRCFFFLMTRRGHLRLGARICSMSNVSRN